MIDECGQDDPTRAPFVRMGPATALSPVVLAVPHAGRDYPPEVRASAAVPFGDIEALEDRHSDLLVAHAVAEGATAILARSPRAVIDLNRGEDDLDPALRGVDRREAPVSARARSGLGLIPTRLARRELWRTAPSPLSIARRLADIHEPYHAAIARALDDAWLRFGHAVLIDCHSMPPLGGGRPPRVVIGDRHGRSAAPGLAACAVAVARDAGLTAVINAPYSGAYTLDRHGAPHRGINALQVEVDRSLYLARGLREVGPGLETARALIAAIARAVRDATQPTAALAAE